MLGYETYPVRDDLLSRCDSFVPSLSALIPQVPSCFKRVRILRKTSCQESNPNVMCKHMQVLLIYRNPVAKTKKEISKGEAVFWFGCCGWELNESHWRCVVGWLDESLSLTLWQQGSENEATNNKKQACKWPKAWSFICSVHRRQQSLLIIARYCYHFYNNNNANFTSFHLPATHFSTNITFKNMKLFFYEHNVVRLKMKFICF